MAAYLAAALLGQHFPVSQSGAAAMWPAAGVAMAAAVFAGRWSLVGIAAGALLAELIATGSLPAAVGFGAVAAGQATLAVLLYRRAEVAGSLERVRDVIGLIAVAIAVSAAAGAVADVWVELLTGRLPMAGALREWRACCLGAVTGGVVIGATAILFLSGPRPQPSWRALCRGGLAAVVFGVSSIALIRYDAAFTYLVLPMLFLLAVAFRQRGAVLGGLLLAAISLYLTGGAHGPFPANSFDVSLLRTQLFLTVAVASALVVAAARSERRQAEATLERLAQSERALAEAQRLARLGSFEWDLRSNRITVSEETRRIFGFPSAGDDPSDHFMWRERIHPDDRPMLRRTIKTACARRGSFAVTHRIVRRDGTVRTVEWRARVEVDAHGRAAALVGTTQDVSAFKLVEEKFRSLFENAPHAGVIVNDDGIIMLVNSQVERLFGYERTTLVGSPLELLLPEQGVNAALSLSAVRRDAAPVEIALSARRRGGSVFPVEMSLAPMRDETGMLFSLAIRDVTEQRRAADALEHEASHDSLTGLPNRSLFLERLGRSINRARRDGSQLAVMFLDLDDFKLVNDTRGHEVGDQLLLALAPRLTAALRPTDIIARFGGDEFVVLCERLAGEHEALTIAGRITEACSRPVELAGEEHVVTVSVGVTVVSDAVEASASDVLRDADAAMYRAKAEGNGRIEIFDRGMRARLLTRLATEAELRRALEQDELRLFYQPVVSLEEDRVVGVEALVRWEHPTRGLLEPTEFIALAEESGLIVPIGEWVIATACRQSARWSRLDLTRALSMSVNLSPRQLARSDVAGTVARELAKSGADPALLVFEITESTLFVDGEDGVRALQDLQALGVRLVLDDFGTGYSSLSNLKQLTIDALKIDRSFVRGLGRDPEDGAIVNAVLSMARALGIGVTAEGVETPLQLARLRQQGCAYVQGYLFGRPVPARELTAMLERRAGLPVPAVVPGEVEAALLGERI